MARSHKDLTLRCKNDAERAVWVTALAKSIPMGSRRRSLEVHIAAATGGDDDTPAEAELMALHVAMMSEEADDRLAYEERRPLDKSKVNTQKEVVKILERELKEAVGSAMAGAEGKSGRTLSDFGGIKRVQSGGLDEESAKRWDDAQHLQRQLVLAEQNLEQQKQLLIFPPIDGWTLRGGEDGSYTGIKRLHLEAFKADFTMRVQPPGPRRAKSRPSPTPLAGPRPRTAAHHSPRSPSLHALRSMPQAGSSCALRRRWCCSSAASSCTGKAAC